MKGLPQGDIWRLIDNDCNSQHYRHSYRLNFTFFESDSIKAIAQKYIWANYTTGIRTLSTLRGTLGDLIHFDAFCRISGVHTLRDLDNGRIDDYRSFLRLRISSTTGQPLSYSSQGKCFSTIRSIVNWCRTFQPEAVSEAQIFTGNEYTHVRGIPKINYIPDHMLKLINNALAVEDNLYLKCGIIILECTGMRVGDLLMLPIDCIAKHPISGYTISWFEYKTRKSRLHVPVMNKCKEAIDVLVSLTAPIRNRAVKEEAKRLFIYAPRLTRHKKPVTTISTVKFGVWGQSFCEKHNIRDESGQLYKITAHMFRRTLATDMLSKGVNLNVIQGLLGHASPSVTRRYYADVKDSSRIAMFSKIGILGDIKNIGQSEIPNSTERQWFQENKGGKARLCDGYCTLPIQNGEPCGRFLKRQKCYLCSRYITTLEDLDAHKKHLEELEELLANNLYGEHFASHIIPTTIVLKEIIRQLEALKNEH